MKIREINNRIYSFIRNEIVLRIDSTKRISVCRYGNEYGGFGIVDNSYINKSIVVFSFGIGEDLSFSDDVMQKIKNSTVYAFDPTPKSIRYVLHHRLSKNDRFHFYEVGLSNKDGKELFYLPNNNQYVSGSIIERKELKNEGILVEMKDLKTICDELGVGSIDILKLDIEGSEFMIVDSIVSFPGKIGQICLETHERFMRLGLVHLYILHKKLCRNGFTIVYNDGETVTYLNKDEIIGPQNMKDMS